VILVVLKFVQNACPEPLEPLKRRHAIKEYEEEEVKGK
jgi:hypothetical protein